jgi:hypothetical protein
MKQETVLLPQDRKLQRGEQSVLLAGQLLKIWGRLIG